MFKPPAAVARTPDEVIRSACEPRGLTLADIRGPARGRWVSAARKECAVALNHSFPQMSNRDIANMLGRKDHTSARHYLGLRP